MSSQGTLVLTREQIASLLSFDEYVLAVSDGFRLHVEGKASLANVVDIDARNGAFHIKSASMELEQSYVAVKVNGNFPDNMGRFGLPTIQGAILLYDGNNGYPLAFMDSIEITINRTGAATVLGAKFLARPDSSSVTICGCGNQGRVSLTGLKSILPIQRAFAFDTNRETAEQFARTMTASLGIPVNPVESLGDAAKKSDVIVTCTPSRKPILELENVAPGTFIAAVGADSHDKQELDPRLLVSSKVVVDDLDQCASIGELHHALTAGLVKTSDVHAQLGELVGGQKTGRTSAEEVIILDTTGTAIQDVAVAAAAFEKARKLGVGTRCRLA